MPAAASVGRHVSGRGAGAASGASGLGGGAPGAAGGARRAFRIVAVDLQRLDLHLAAGHRTSYGEERYRPVVLARVVVEGGDVAGGAEGWGECAALAEPTYDEEYATGAWAVLRDHLGPRLLGAEVVTDGDVMHTLHGVGRVLGAVRGHRMAKACLEMAVADAVLRRSGRSLASALGVETTHVAAGAAVGLPVDLGRARDEVAGAVAAGFSRVRVKIAPGCDVGPVRSLRSSFPDLALQVDANGAYGRDGARVLDGLDDLGLACVEQPLDPADLLGHAELVRRWRTPVCLDESVRDAADVDVVAALGAATLICLKPARLGGIGPAVDAHRRARSAGIGLWCGGMLQTARGRAVDAAVSGLPGFVLAGDLGAASPAFVEPDPFGGVELRSGSVKVYQGAGVGPPPDADRLRAVTVEEVSVVR